MFLARKSAIGFLQMSLLVAAWLFAGATCLGGNMGKAAPPLLLAEVYWPGAAVSEFLVSEKYDGVRAYWDGRRFSTRAGNTILAPGWFTEKFPGTPLDGELWLGYGRFEEISGLTRKITPVDSEWRNVQYLVFELPEAPGTFAERAEAIKKIAKDTALPQLKAVEQMHVKNEPALQTLLKQVLAKGGEGLMLHRADAPYLSGRNPALLKLKPLLDAEAKVIAHTSGKGKYAGKLGALEVETPEGIRFKIGTGFSDAERNNPPGIGSTITYSYRGLSKKGKPKFASYLRERHDPQ
jgi:DNA ligase 1